VSKPNFVTLKQDKQNIMPKKRTVISTVFLPLIPQLYLSL